MADAETEIDLDQLHQAIIDTIAAKFGSAGTGELPTVEDYPEDRKPPAAAKCVIELVEAPADGAADPGTEQQAFLTRWEARVMIHSLRTPNAKRAVRKLALALAAFIRLQRWGLPVGAADVIGAFPDDFDPELDQFEVWRVEWQQVAHIGATVWTNDGTLPVEVLASYSPLTGPPNIEHYEPITEPPEA